MHFFQVSKAARSWVISPVIVLKNPLHVETNAYFASIRKAPSISNAPKLKLEAHFHNTPSRPIIPVYCSILRIQSWTNTCVKVDF